jgi:hypothetical protein
MSSDIALRSDVPTQLGEQLELAKALAVSGIIPSHLQRKPENILAIMYAARSIDVPLWQAIQSMQVISGKVGISADLARALILRAGHTFRVVESTNETATVEVVRRGEDYVHRATFTLFDARQAGLTGNNTWSKYPKAMLIARATTLIARVACADVLAGMSYTPEELGATVDEEGRIVEDHSPAPRPAAVPANVNATTGEVIEAEIVEEGLRPLEELPRNKDGSISRSQITEDEKAANGLMTNADLKEHNALQPKKADNSSKVERLATTPESDPWVDAQAGDLPLGPMPSQVWCEGWVERVEATTDIGVLGMLGSELNAAHRESKIGSKQFAELKKIGANRKAELTAPVEASA